MSTGIWRRNGLPKDPHRFLSFALKKTRPEPGVNNFQPFPKQSNALSLDTIDFDHCLTHAPGVTQNTVVLHFPQLVWFLVSVLVLGKQTQQYPTQLQNELILSDWNMTAFILSVEYSNPQKDRKVRNLEI